MSARLVDVETSQMLLTDHIDHKGEIDGLLQKMRELAQALARVNSGEECRKNSGIKSRIQTVSSFRHSHLSEGGERMLTPMERSTITRLKKRGLTNRAIADLSGSDRPPRPGKEERVSSS